MKTSAAMVLGFGVIVWLLMRNKTQNNAGIVAVAGIRG